MRRGKQHSMTDYIEVRISQLTADMNKAHDEYDKQWYNRLIQELCWVKDQQHNCFIGKKIDWKEFAQ